MRRDDHEVIRRFGVTRSIPDRIFVFLLGAVVGSGAGYLLWHVLHRSAADQLPPEEWVARIVLIAFEEFVLAVFALSLCGIIWGLFVPHWLERFFAQAIWKLYLALGLIVLALGVAATYVFAAG